MKVGLTTPRTGQRYTDTRGVSGAWDTNEGGMTAAKRMKELNPHEDVEYRATLYLSTDSNRMEELWALYDAPQSATNRAILRFAIRAVRDRDFNAEQAFSDMLKEVSDER